MTKPFRPLELVARVKLRRYKRYDPEENRRIYLLFPGL